jgi:hypothetical protein
VWAINAVDGKPHLRYLRAMFMEPGCDKCHGILGYKTGDMRGATGLNLPLDNYLAQIAAARSGLAFTHIAIWLIGLAGIFWGNWLGANWARERDKRAPGAGGASRSARSPGRRTDRRTGPRHDAAEAASREEHFPGHHEPRNPHPAQRHYRRFARLRRNGLLAGQDEQLAGSTRPADTCST